MRKFILGLFIIFSIFAFLSSAHAANVVRAAVALTGGGTGALDAISQADLTDGDIGIVVTSGTTYFYYYDADAEDATNSPFIIRPADYDVGVWKLASFTGGTILGKVNIVVTTDGTESPTAAQMYGTIFIADHSTSSSDTDYTLPGVEAGMSACFYDNGSGTGGIIIDAAAGDEILLNGTSVGAGDAIDSPGVAGDGANGDFICLVGIDSTYWITVGRSGTWVDGGAD